MVGRSGADHKPRNRGRTGTFRADVRNKAGRGMRIGASVGVFALFLGAAMLSAEELMQTAGDTPVQVAAQAARSGADPSGNSAARKAECQPGRGCVTGQPLPRFVSLKGEEGNARRGPGLTHRIDWVFTRPGMPLKITAEYENWRRVEDQEGAGGWVHYVLLSATRTALITLDMAELHADPDGASRVVAQAELGVVAKILECESNWCRLSAGGEKGWVEKSAIWGVLPDEIIE